jgi:ABC-type multidrug transport system fused ATPase/permease subunit
MKVISFLKATFTPWISYVSLCLRFLESDRKKYLAWGGVSFVGYFYFLVPPFVIGKIVALITLHHEYPLSSTVLTWVGGFFVVGVFLQLMRLESNRRLKQIKISASHKARVRGIEYFLQQSLVWHEAHTTGEKTERLQKGADAVERSLYLLYHDMLPLFAQLVGVLVAFLIGDFALLLCALFYISIFLYFQRSFAARLDKGYQEVRELQERASGKVTETMGTLTTLTLTGATTSHQQSVVAMEGRVEAKRVEVGNLLTLKWKYFQSFNSFALTSFLFIALWQVTSSSLHIEFLFPLFIYLGVTRLNKTLCED